MWPRSLILEIFRLQAISVSAKDLADLWLSLWSGFKMLNFSFWRDRRVLLTGHTGFKGAWLTVLLDSLGAKVSGYSSGTLTKPSFFEICSLEKLLEHSFEADIRDQSALQKCLSITQPEIIIHGAAQALVRESYLNPSETCDVNIMGVVSLFSAVLRHFQDGNRSLKALVNVTTDKCYENNGSKVLPGVASGIVEFVEGDSLGGEDIYSASKACSEIITLAYRKSFFSGVEGAPLIATARAGNVIGGGDWAKDRLIPDCLRSFESGRPVVLRYPGATRPWQHVLNPILGYLLLCEKLARGDLACARSFNFGPTSEDVLPVIDVVNRLNSKLDGPGCVVDDGVQLHEAATLALDSSLARSVLGWRPAVDLNTALDMIAVWHSCYRDNGDLLSLTREQICFALKR
jgi:CDP-glucose 4,6-dehydratase